MRLSRLVAAAGVGVLMLGASACSSTGGKPDSSGGGDMGAGTADTRGSPSR